MTIPNAAQANQMITIGNTLATTGAAILAALGTPPLIPPATTGASPDRTTCPPAASINDGAHIWTLGAQHGSGGKLILRDGQSAAGGEANSITIISGAIYVLNALGQWYRWNGNGWAATGAP